MKFLFFLSIFLFSFYSCKKKSEPPLQPQKSENETTKEEKKVEPLSVKEKVLKSRIGGRWYTDDGIELKKEVEKYIEEVSPQNPETEKNKLIALISPHAGYRYSGKVAANGYKLLKGKDFKRVIVIGPSHHSYFTGVSIPPATHIETPIGKVEVDIDVVKELKKNPLFITRSDAHIMEHSVEIQIPFLQVVLSQFKMLELVAGNLSEEEIKSVAKALRPFIDEKTIVIASSDFTHYGSNYGYIPFKDKVEENIRKLDFGSFEKIEKLDLKGFMEYKSKTGITICGFIPICILLALLEEVGEIDVNLIKYDTSGNILSDFTNSVSYFSIAFLKRKIPSALREIEILNDKEERTLLSLARLTLRRHLNGRELPTPEKDNIRLTEKLKENYGVFVTLKKHGDLRGCIGNIFPVKPLWEGVIENTLNAASYDRRFTPVTKKEEGEIEIEISVLSKPHRVQSFNEIFLGRDGIIISKDERSAVFLPQVPVEQQWSLEETLSHLSLKAGLNPMAWKEKMEFHIFSAEVFHE